MAATLKNVFTIEELELIKQSFAKADINKDKVLSLPEFKNIMASSKLVPKYIFNATYYTTTYHNKKLKYVLNYYRANTFQNLDWWWSL
jgi:hypothetical protein